MMQSHRTRARVATLCAIGAISLVGFSSPASAKNIAVGSASRHSAKSSPLAWPTWGSTPGGTFFAGTDKAINSKNVSNLKDSDENGTGWPYVGGIGPEDNNNAPDVVGGVAYASGDSSVIAMNAPTGNTLWSSSISPYTAPAVSDGRVFVGTKDGQLTALDANSGTTIWTDTVASDGMSDPTIYRHNVLMTDGPIIYNLSQKTGTIKWQYDCSSVVTSDGFPLCNSGSGQDLSAAVVLGDTLYFTSEAFTFALTSSGKLKWYTYNDEADYAYFANPVATNGLVYSAALNGDGSSELEALNASSGDLVWQDIGGWSGGDMAVANGVLYDSNGSLEAWNASTGAEMWTGGTSGAGVTVVDNVVFYGGGALDASTGAQLWSNPVGCDTPMTVYGSNMFCGVQGSLYRFYEK
jgi:outer membrane protein assembly factor BamB